MSPLQQLAMFGRVQQMVELLGQQLREQRLLPMTSLQGSQLKHGTEDMRICLTHGMEVQ